MEFHGWINIQCTEDDEEESYIMYERQTLLCNDIQEKISQIEWCNGKFQILRGMNGQDYLTINGCANHHQQSVIELFFWIASLNTDSYGILHIIDDDKIGMDINYGVRAWRLIKNEVIEYKDQIMSSDIKKMLNIYD